VAQTDRTPGAGTATADPALTRTQELVARHRAGQKRRRRVLQPNIVYPTVFIAAVIVLWEIVARVTDVPAYILPAPLRIGERLVSSAPILWDNTLATLTAIGVGYVIGVLIGAVLALWMAYSAIVRNTLYPPIIASQAVPKIAIAPLLVLWLGFDIWPKVAVVALMVFFPITITMVEGLRSVDPRLLDLLRSVHAGRAQIFFKVSLPHALPHIFSGLKIGITLAVVGAVVGEWVGADAGLGYLLIIANTRLDATLLFSALVLLVVIGIVLFLAVGALERLIVPWKEEEEAGDEAAMEAVGL
jgi:NitT/TauT family transport system permease protein